MPAGRVSSNIMMLSPVSRPSSFIAKERPGVGELKCFPPPAGTTKPFAAVMSVSSPWENEHNGLRLCRLAQDDPSLGSDERQLFGVKPGI